MTYKDKITMPDAGSDNVSRWRNLLAWAALVTLLVAALLWSGTAQLEPFNAAAMRGLAVALFGMALLGAALWHVDITGTKSTSTDKAHSPSQQHTPPKNAARNDALLVLLGALLLAVATEATANFTNTPRLIDLATHVQFVLWLAGCLLVVRGLGGCWRAPYPASPAHPALIVPRFEWLLIALIVLVALGLRVWRLNTSITVLVDELHFVSGVKDLWNLPSTNFFGPLSVTSPYTWLHPYLQSILVALFGRDFMGLRLLSAITGALTVGATWWLARHLFDRPTALFAALLLAGLPPHLHFSRLALNNIGDPLFGTLALAYLARAHLSRARMDYALAGAMLALALYFHEAGRLFFPLLVLVWVLWQWVNPALRTQPQQPQNTHSLQNAFALLAAFGLIATPVMVAVARSPYDTFGRLSASGYGLDYFADVFTNVDALRAHLWHTLQGFLVLVHLPENADAGYYLGHTPLLLTPLVPLFLIGLAALLWRPRGRGSLPLLWLLGMVAGASLLLNSTTSVRFVVVLPALAIICAWGVRVIVPLLVPSVNPQRAASEIMAALGVILCIMGAGYYFQLHLPQFNQDYRLQRPYGDLEDVVLRTAQDLPRATIAHLIIEETNTDFYVKEMLAFWRDDVNIDVIDRDDLTEGFFLNLRRDLPQAFFLEPGDRTTIPLAMPLIVNIGPPQTTDNPDTPPGLAYTLYLAPPVDPMPNFYFEDRSQNYEDGLSWVALALFGVAVIMTQIPRPFYTTRRWALWRDDLRFWGVAATVAATIAALGFWPGLNPRPFTLPVMIGIFTFLLCGWLLMVGLLTQHQVRPIADTVAYHTQGRRIRVPHLLMLTGGVGLMWFVGEAGGGYLGVAAIDGISPHVQFVAWVGGIVLIIRGLTGIIPVWRGATARDERLRIDRSEVLLLAGILLLALVLRFWHLGDTITVMVDEVNFASSVQWFWAFDNVPLMENMSQVIPFPRIFTYWQSWTLALFGRDLMGFRATSALFGVATVAATWWLARHLFDKRMGLLAALILAAFPPHLHFSRLALNNIAEPLFGVLTFAFLARGWRSGDRVDFVLAGVSFGLTQYFFEAGRLLYPPLLLTWLGWTWLVDRRRFTRQMWINLGLLLLAAALVAFTYYYTVLGNGARFAGRFEASGQRLSYWEMLVEGTREQRRVFLDNAIFALLAYVHRPELYIFYGGNTGLVLPFLVPGLLLGFWQLLLRAVWPGRWHTTTATGAFLIVAWIGATAAGNMLLVQTATTTRFVIVFPALAIAIAAGILYTLPWLLRLPDWRGPRVGRIAAALGILAVITQTAYYFGPHLTQFNTQFREVRVYRDIEDAVLRATELPIGTQIHLVTEHPVYNLYIRDMLRLLADGYDIETLMSSEVRDETFFGLRRDIPQAVFVVPNDSETLRLVQNGLGPLPPPRFTSNAAVPDNEQFTLYYYPPLVDVPFPEVDTFPARHTRELRIMALMLLAFGVALTGLRWLMLHGNLSRLRR